MTDAQIATLLQAHGPGHVLGHADAGDTVLAWLQLDGALAVRRLGIGPQTLTQAALRHRPPTPAELERAIDLVEDAVMRLSGAVPSNQSLLASGAFRRVVDSVDGRQRDDVEALFQRLASVALGHPSAAAGLPDDTEFVAAALLLRECMHHLGFEALA